MDITLALLKAENIGVRHFKNNLCRYLQRARTYIITEHGQPTSVVIPYDEVMELVDVLDELQDPEILRIIQEGRKAIKRGVKGRLVSRLFGRVRSKNK